jgi:hypothetical protein
MGGQPKGLCGWSNRIEEGAKQEEMKSEVGLRAIIEGFVHHVRDMRFLLQ